MDYKKKPELKGIKPMNPAITFPNIRSLTLDIPAPQADCMLCRIKYDQVGCQKSVWVPLVHLHEELAQTIHRVLKSYCTDWPGCINLLDPAKKFPVNSEKKGTLVILRARNIMFVPYFRAEHHIIALEGRRDDGRNEYGNYSGSF